MLTSLQPPRFTPKVFQLLLKTHKLVVVVSIDASLTISALKEVALNALQSDLLRTHESNEAEMRALQRSRDADAMDDDELDLGGLGAGGELGLGLDAGGEMGLGLGTGVRADAFLADEERIPEVQSTDDFELCRGSRAKGAPAFQPGGAPTPPATFDVLKDGAVVKTALVNWESVYLQFREKSSGVSPYLLIRQLKD